MTHFNDRGTPKRRVMPEHCKEALRAAIGVACLFGLLYAGLVFTP
ncbi:MAG: hypothetical protein ACRC14_04710 [Paracoccaceae bacterium]